MPLVDERIKGLVQLTWPEIWKLFQGAIAVAGSILEDPAQWKATADGEESGPIREVSLGIHGVTFKFNDDLGEHVITAVPDSFGRAGTLFDGLKDDSAQVMVSFRSQPPLKPVILVVEFVNVAVGGAKTRYRFDCPH